MIMNWQLLLLQPSQQCCYANFIILKLFMQTIPWGVYYTLKTPMCVLFPWLLLMGNTVIYNYTLQCIDKSLQPTVSSNKSCLLVKCNLTDFSSCLNYAAENNQRFRSDVSNSVSYTKKHTHTVKEGRKRIKITWCLFILLSCWSFVLTTLFCSFLSNEKSTSLVASAYVFGLHLLGMQVQLCVRHSCHLWLEMLCRNTSDMWQALQMRL